MLQMTRICTDFSNPLQDAYYSCERKNPRKFAKSASFAFPIVRAGLLGIKFQLELKCVDRCDRSGFFTTGGKGQRGRGQ